MSIASLLGQHVGRGIGAGFVSQRLHAATSGRVSEEVRSLCRWLREMRQPCRWPVVLPQEFTVRLLDGGEFLPDALCANRDRAAFVSVNSYFARSRCDLPLLRVAPHLPACGVPFYLAHELEGGRFDVERIHDGIRLEPCIAEEVTP